MPANLRRQPRLVDPQLAAIQNNLRSETIPINIVRNATASGRNTIASSVDTRARSLRSKPQKPEDLVSSKMPPRQKMSYYSQASKNQDPIRIEDLIDSNPTTVASATLKKEEILPPKDTPSKQMDTSRLKSTPPKAFDASELFLRRTLANERSCRGLRKKLGNEDASKNEGNEGNEGNEDASKSNDTDSDQTTLASAPTSCANEDTSGDSESKTVVSISGPADESNLAADESSSTKCPPKGLPNDGNEIYGELEEGVKDDEPSIDEEELARLKAIEEEKLAKLAEAAKMMEVGNPACRCDIPKIALKRIREYLDSRPQYDNFKQAQLDALMKKEAEKIRQKVQEEEDEKKRDAAAAKGVSADDMDDDSESSDDDDDEEVNEQNTMSDELMAQLESGEVKRVIDWDKPPLFEVRDNKTSRYRLAMKGMFRSCGRLKPDMTVRHLDYDMAEPPEIPIHENRTYAARRTLSQEQAAKLKHDLENAKPRFANVVKS